MEFKYAVGSFVLMLVCVAYYYFQPKQINSIYGYRTRMSRKNPENWKLANRLASTILIVISVILLLLSVFFCYLRRPDIGIFWLYTLLIGLAFLFIIVEIKLIKISNSQ